MEENIQNIQIPQTSTQRAFSQAASSVAQLYKESQREREEAYKEGQRAAYQDILNFLCKNEEQEYKYISVSQFVSFIEKREETLREGGGLPYSSHQEMRGLEGGFYKIRDNKKRLGRGELFPVEEGMGDEGLPRKIYHVKRKKGGDDLQGEGGYGGHYPYDDQWGNK